MKTLLIVVALVFATNSWAQTLVGTGQTYTNLKSAFDAINAGTLTGNVVLKITSSTVEVAPAVLNASGGTANYTSILIYPGVTGCTISGNISGNLIDLNGADNVTMDGRVNQAGGKDLEISNASASATATTINLSNDASANILKYIILKGATTNNGVVTFAGTTGTTGNDNNTIQFCTIKEDVNKPKYLIYSAGVLSAENSGNTISNCELLNFNGGGTTAAIYVSANSSDWTINNNSIYQTAAYAGTASTIIYGIYINGGDNFSILNNAIGGSTIAAGGNAWEINGTAATCKFIGIYNASGALTASSIQGNKIKNISWLTSATAGSSPGVWCGIHNASGNISIGGTTGNIIGDSIGTGSIKIITTSSASHGYCFGISNISTGTSIQISNNAIGSITVGDGISTTALAALYLLHNGGGTVGQSIINISNNLIGSYTTANSINHLNPTTNTINQFVNCLYNNASGTANITSNTIANINNNYKASGTNANSICGIFIGGGSNTVSGNVIRNLSSTGISTGSGIGTTVLGIFVRDIAAITGNQTISSNTIYSLSSTAATAAVTLAGIYIDAPSLTATNTIEKNKIFDINASTSAVALINGIYLASAGNTAIVKNNFISLGENLSAAYTINGIFDSIGTNNYFFNSVRIGGSSVIGTATTSAFTSLVTNKTRSFTNNIFYNARSNSTGTGKHYAIKTAGTIVNPVGLTCNYNDLYVSGTGGVLGLYNTADRTTLTAWQTAIGQDSNSISEDPQFLSEINLHISNSVISPVGNIGSTVVGITEDIDGDLRSNYPDMGADEFVGLAVNNCTGTPDTSSIIGVSVICSGSSTSLSLNNTYNFNGISYQWKYSATAGGPYTNSDTLSTLSTGALSANRYYICKITCLNSGLFFTTAEKLVVITTPPSASIQYTGSPYCGSDTANHFVVITGTNGGSFSATPTGLSINNTSGVIKPSLSSVGNYTIVYTIAATGGCSSFNTNTSVVINSAPSASLSYSGNPFCTSQTAAQAVYLSGTTGGKFYATPSGLTIDSVTGSITPSSSTAGGYIVHYAISLGSCSDTFNSSTITVSAAPTASISYANSSYCKSIATPQAATLVGSTGGTFGSSAGLTINATTGAITPSTSTAGVYSISYTIPASGGCAAAVCSTQVIINPLPANAGLITSIKNDSVTRGESNAIYTVSTIAFATTYVWSYSGTGVTFVPASTTVSDSVKINFSATATSGNLTVKGHNACGDGVVSASYPIYVSPVGIREIGKEMSFQLYPNPTSGTVTVKFNDINTSMEVEILSINGQIIQSEKLPMNCQTYTFDLSKHSKGIYFIKIFNNDYLTIEKIVLQ